MAGLALAVLTPSHRSQSYPRPPLANLPLTVPICEGKTLVATTPFSPKRRFDPLCPAVAVYKPVVSQSPCPPAAMADGRPIRHSNVIICGSQWPHHSPASAFEVSECLPQPPESSSSRTQSLESLPSFALVSVATKPRPRTLGSWEASLGPSPVKSTGDVEK